LLYWAVIKKYVRRIVELYYAGDQDVANDSELQDFMEESKVSEDRLSPLGTSNICCQPQTISNWKLEAQSFEIIIVKEIRILVR
jgi:hypothetical protein